MIPHDKRIRFIKMIWPLSVGFFYWGGGGVGTLPGLMIYIPFDALINHVETRFKRFRVGIVSLIPELFLSFEGKGMVGALLDVTTDKD